MYILTRSNKVIDYCEDGYLLVGSTVVCESKKCVFENATIVDIGNTTLPGDIPYKSYYYIHGSFIPCSLPPEIIIHEGVENLPKVVNGAILIAFE